MNNSARNHSSCLGECETCGPLAYGGSALAIAEALVAVGYIRQTEPFRFLDVNKHGSLNRPAANFLLRQVEVDTPVRRVISETIDGHHYQTVPTRR